jgi:acetyl-CoA carboxylase carboxyl transferase subunit alpha
MVIGQEKGRDTKSKIKHNFGMMHPEGYRKALRLMKLAEKFNMPIVTFIDTPGAYPGIKAEERGQSEAIARNLFEMSALKVPVVCTVIGEGCSGGALGIGVGDRLLMLQYSYFATISPEGCATILHKTADKASEITKMMNITSDRLKELNIIDGIIPEPLGGAHRDFVGTANNIKKSLMNELNTLSKLSVEDRNSKRYDKLMSFGQFKG